ncbi:DEAD/DEAH box helicase [Xanthomonas axonopodis]|uniref:DEAD/DEAH box helicase n=1 Tax=Xanthomonas axonopodis TaxID=53413 RepID=UPI0009964C05|nr:ATP-binding domain-containing protein [Xanthomonas axonopodis]
MERRIASPALRNDPLAQSLIEKLSKVSDQFNLTDAVTYYDFPMFRDTEDELLRSQSMFASRETGLIFFGVATDGGEISDIDESLGQLYSLALARLVKNPRLRASRNELSVKMETCIFAPGVQAEGVDSTVVTSDESLSKFIEGQCDTALSTDAWDELISTVEGSSALRREREKGLASAPPGSKGAILNAIYSRIASFDQDQRRAAITLVDGPQRIRGIAGSGKTVVLAMKAAHIHLVRPDARILITFWTKSLYDQFKYLVAKFYRQFSDRDPDWDRVNILHAWGGKTTGGGVYYNAAIGAGVVPATLSDVKRGGLRPSFSSICEELVATGSIRQFYDYALIDEGQDLPSSFYQLCFHLTNGPDVDRNVIWAYDELQTILDVSVQNVRDTFGTRPDGRDRMDLVRAEDELSHGLQPHDIVLKRSYRNPAEVMITAHALGFGIYSDRVVQILENARHWEDLGYQIIEGECIAGKRVKIRRPAENSPINVASYQGAGNVIEAQSFQDYNQEVSWVCAQIKRFLKEGLRPQDLLVISLDDRHAKMYFSDIAKDLLSNDIGVNNLSLPSFGTPNFFVDGAATLSTVYKAKGNEAAAVFVVGVDAIALATDPVRGRNRLFAALTRSKAWLRVSGVGSFAQIYVQEIATSLVNFPDLDFVYPNPAAVRTIQRDLAERSAKLTKLQKLINELGLSNLSDAEIEAVFKAGGVKKER